MARERITVGALPGSLGKTLLMAVERARLGVVIAALEDGVGAPIYLSESVVDSFGQTREELMQLDWLGLFPPADRARAVEVTRRIVAGEPVAPHLDTTITTAAGRRFALEVAFADLVQKGRVLTVGVLTELSGRLAAQRVPAPHLEDQLARAERLAALGMLAAGVAHEINNPLAFMTLNVEVLVRLIEREMQHGNARTRALAVASDIGEGVRRVASIVRDLRAFSLHDDVDDALVDLSNVVASAEQLAQHAVGGRARVLIELSMLPAIRASAFRLEQVFVNLLVNAAQAFARAADGNIIRVSGGLLENQSVFVDVQDNGPGIPPEVVRRIFDPFFTTKAIGTGLGLSICHGIISRLGGKLTVHSRVGAGSTFRVVLPTSRDAPAVDLEPSVRRRRDPHRRRFRGGVIRHASLDSAQGIESRGPRPRLPVVSATDRERSGAASTMVDDDDHSACVNTWLQRAAELPPEQLLHLFQRGFTAMWQRAHQTLGDVTLTAIVDRVVHTAAEQYPIYSTVNVEVTGIDFRGLNERGASLTREQLVPAIRLVLVEFLTVLGNLTAEVLTPALHAALIGVAPDDRGDDEKQAAREPRDTQSGGEGSES